MLQDQREKRKKEGENESEVKEEKARLGRLTLYLINQSERGIGKAASATFGSEGLAV